MNQTLSPSRFRRFAGVIGSWPALFIALVVLALLWTFLEFGGVIEESYGEFARVIGRQVLIGLTTLVLLVGFFVNGGISQVLKGAAVLLLILGTVGLYFSIRSIGFTGDNHLVIDWVWNPTTEDRLEQAGRAEDLTLTQPLDASMLEGPEFPSFLGPARDGQVLTTFSAKWTDKAPRELWRFPIGGGYAAFAGKGDIAVTIEQRGPREVISAYHAAMGKPLWSHGYEAHFSEEMGGDGPRATPTIDGQHAFALGATGVLTCIDLLTGAVVWSRNIIEDAGAENAIWGMSGSPLVVNGHVIVNAGGPAKSLIAYDRTSGEIVWAHGTHKAGYASPLRANLLGVDQIIIFDFDGVAGHDLATGRELWRFAVPTMNGINVGQPVVIGDDRVFVSASYGSGATMLLIEKNGEDWSAKDEWKSQSMRCKFTSPVLVDGHLYGLDDGILVCVDPKTRKRLWKKGRYGHGQVMACGKQLLVMAETGDVAIVEANPEKFIELTKWKALPGEKNWNAPCLLGQKLLVRNHFEMACFELPAADDVRTTSR